MSTEQIETGSKKVRGRARKSLELIEAMYRAAEAAQPITGRGIGYQLFTAGLITYFVVYPGRFTALVTWITGLTH